MINELARASLPEKTLTRRDRVVKACLALILAVAVASCFLLRHTLDLVPECVFRQLTGVSCLTCGLTRSLDAMAHGHVLTALQFHALGPFVLAGMIVACVACAAGALSGRRILRLQAWPRRVLLSFAVMWIVFGFVRMVVESL
jgi:hypothetical protein